MATHDELQVTLQFLSAQRLRGHPPTKVAVATVLAAWVRASRGISGPGWLEAAQNHVEDAERGHFWPSPGQLKALAPKQAPLPVLEDKGEAIAIGRQLRTEFDERYAERKRCPYCHQPMDAHRHECPRAWLDRLVA